MPVSARAVVVEVRMVVWLLVGLLVGLGNVIEEPSIAEQREEPLEG